MVSIYTYVDFRKYLHEIYWERKNRNTAFSHRYIEQHIAVSPGYFSRILKGEKNISDELILRIGLFLKFSKKELLYFENMVKYCQAKDVNTRALYYARLLECSPELSRKSLAREQFAFFQEPHHVAVHGLINVLKIHAKTDFSAIGKLLIPPLTAKKVRDSIRLMLKLQLVTLDKHQHYQLSGRLLTTGNHPKEETLRKFLMDSFLRARNAVDMIPENERSSSIMTLSVSEKAFTEIKEKLAATRNEINQIVEHDDDLDRVYQLGMYLVPVTQKVTREKKNA